MGFGSSVGLEYIKRGWEKRDEKEKAKNILKALIQEIEEGIERAEGLIKFLENNKISFSRIYTEYWRSTNSILSQYINDIEILNLLHRIYYRFDLINFNMDRNRFGVGAAFAKQYIDEIKENFRKLKVKID
ncbi:hypothetical protein J7J74_00780 [bacterium]|nr:hypothetical protein [bacterium]